MEFSKIFVERINELMCEHKLNAKLLAERTGIHPTSISKWFNFATNVSLNQLIILADFFNCSIDYLIGRTDNYLTFSPQQVKSFSKNIRKIMTEKGYTRYRFVKETRFTEAHIYQWDKGTIPKLYTLIELSDLFDCSIDYLIGRE